MYRPLLKWKQLVLKWTSAGQPDPAARRRLVRRDQDPVLLAGDQVLRAVVSEQRGVLHADACYLLVPFGDGGADVQLDGVPVVAGQRVADPVAERVRVVLAGPRADVMYRRAHRVAVHP